MNWENPMSSLRTLLQQADPLPREAPRLDAARERIRLAMLRAADDQRSWRAVRLPMLASVLAVALVAALGYALWERGSTPVFAAVRFEVRLAEDQPTPGLIVAQVGQSNRLVYLHPEIVVSNDDIAEASISQDGPAQFSINVRFLEPGTERLRQASAAHLGRPVAILIDGRVVMTPVVRAPIGEWAMITGPFSKADAERIAEGIGR